MNSVAMFGAVVDGIWTCNFCCQDPKPVTVYVGVICDGCGAVAGVWEEDGRMVKKTALAAMREAVRAPE